MERQMVVSYAPGHSDPSVPMIRLKGKWLLRFGFNHGDKISVLVEQEKITINKVTQQKCTEEKNVQEDLHDQL